MMDKVAIVLESYQLIRKDLGLEEEWVCGEMENAFDRLETYLTAQIARLLDQDFNGLLNALYRIDIHEVEAKRIFATEKDVANALAKAVIRREKEKATTRLKYRTG